MSDRHVEFFGPDLGRGPFAAHRIETAALQIATALAQLRTPLTRSDADLLAHGDFIRTLADRLAPDYAAAVAVDVGTESVNQIACSLRTALSAHSLIECWLADTIGGGVSATAPDSITFHSGAVLRTILTNRHFLLITTDTGIVDLNVQYSGVKSWRWALARHGRVFYSTTLQFT